MAPFAVSLHGAAAVASFARGQIGLSEKAPFLGASVPFCVGGGTSGAAERTKQKGREVGLCA